MIKGRGNRTPGGLLGNGLFSLEREMLRGVFVEVLELQQVKGKVLELEELSYGPEAGLRALCRAGGRGLSGVGWELPERQVWLAGAGHPVLDWSTKSALGAQPGDLQARRGSCSVPYAEGSAPPREEPAALGRGSAAIRPPDSRPAACPPSHHQEPKSPNIH